MHSLIQGFLFRFNVDRSFIGNLRGRRAGCRNEPVAFAAGCSLANVCNRAERGRERIATDVGALSAGAYPLECIGRPRQKNLLRHDTVGIGADVLCELP